MVDDMNENENICSFKIDIAKSKRAAIIRFVRDFTLILCVTVAFLIVVEDMKYIGILLICGAGYLLYEFISLLNLKKKLSKFLIYFSNGFICLSYGSKLHQLSCSDLRIVNVKKIRMI